MTLSSAATWVICRVQQLKFYMTTIRGSQVATGSKDTLELELQLPSKGYWTAYCLRPCAKNRISLPPLKSQLVKCTSRCRTSGCRFPRLSVATTVNRTAPLPWGSHQGYFKTFCLHLKFSLFTIVLPCPTVFNWCICPHFDYGLHRLRSKEQRRDSNNADARDASMAQWEFCDLVYWCLLFVACRIPFELIVTCRCIGSVISTRNKQICFSCFQHQLEVLYIHLHD